ncbi:hypothetical protein B7486_56405 [cyanobacterium TDX16]|nr:hypothetical protein B7486_56405 [cyanobacterium TDX16]
MIAPAGGAGPGLEGASSVAAMHLRAGAKLGFSAALAVLVVSGGCGSEEADREGADASAPVEEQASASDAVLDELGDDDPGCAAAVSVEGEVVWTGAGGLADVDAEVAIDETTVFDVGSTSKPLTATLVLLLDEQGVLDLDAPIGTLVDGLPAWGEEVTLAQLLLHTGGVPDYVELLYDAGYEDADTTTTAAALELLAEEEQLDGEPGERFEYSNSGYLLAAVAVEEATGEDFADVMAAEVFEPLELDAEVDPITSDPAKATSYVGDGDEWEVADSAWEQVGDGAVQTTATELVTWAPELWDPELGEDVAITRLADAVPDDEAGDDYGYGIEIADDDELGAVLSHSGAWAGFVADLVALPDDEVAAAVTCNTPDLLDPSEAARALAAVWRP